MKSFKDFASENNISYEAVRQQIKRYSIDLDGHIFREGRTQYLDDYAVQFLESKRKKNPVVVITSSKDDELEHLRDENKALLIKLADAQESIISFQSQLLEAAKSQQQLVAAQTESARLNDELLATQRQLAEITEELTRTKAELEASQKRKGFLSLIFGGR